MAKGKFSQPRHTYDNEPVPPRRKIRPTEAETQPLPPVTGNPILPPEEAEPVLPTWETASTEPRQPVRETEEPEGSAFDDEEPEEEVPEKARPGFAESALAFLARNRKYILIGACAVVLVVLLGVIAVVSITAASDPYDGKILNNVIVAGVNVGGMTKSEAEDAVAAVTDSTFTQQDMVIQLADQQLRLSPKDTGAKLDVKAVVKAAYNYGRTGTKTEQQAAYNQSLTGNHTIGLLPYLALNEDYIHGVLEDYASQYDTVYEPSSYELEGERPSLSAEEFDETVPCQTLLLHVGTPGLGLDINKLYNDILDAYSFNIFLVEVDKTEAATVPEPLDLEAIYQELCVEPVSATANMQTFEPIPGSYG